MKEFIADKPPQVKRPDHTAADILAELRKQTNLQIHIRRYLRLIAWCVLLYLVLPLTLLIALMLYSIAGMQPSYVP